MKLKSETRSGNSPASVVVVHARSCAMDAFKNQIDPSKIYFLLASRLRHYTHACNFKLLTKQIGMGYNIVLGMGITTQFFA